MNIYTVGETILDEWHWLEPELVKAKGRSLDTRLTTGHWLVDILNKRAFVAVVKYSSGELACVALVYVKPDTLHVEAWAGKGMKDWLPECLDKLQEWAKGFGVEHITSKSRPGAARVLQRVGGWKVHDYYMKAEVTS